MGSDSGRRGKGARRRSVSRRSRSHGRRSKASVGELGGAARAPAATSASQTSLVTMVMAAAVYAGISIVITLVNKKLLDGRSASWFALPLSAVQTLFTAMWLLIQRLRGAKAGFPSISRVNLLHTTKIAVVFVLYVVSGCYR